MSARVRKGEELLATKPVKDTDFDGWKLVTRDLVEKSFGKGNDIVGSIMNTGPPMQVISRDTSEREREARRVARLEAALSQLRHAIELLEASAPTPKPAAPPQPSSQKIFLVHGRDDAAKHGVSRFLEKLGQDVVILHEQPNEGRTIIEKFEVHANAGFAVVLLTPDDLGALKQEADAELKPRARQNVIFELGYFTGKLSRARVCALYVAGVELPSDYAGVLFVLLDDAGGWKRQLAKELKQAGFAIDMNHVVA